MRIDWTTITTDQAKRLVGVARRAENIATERARHDDSDASLEAMMSAYTVWENLQVFILTGERPD